MAKYRCINAGGTDRLEEGKIYEGIKEKGYIYLEDHANSCDNSWFEHRFELVEEKLVEEESTIKYKYLCLDVEGAKELNYLEVYEGEIDDNFVSILNKERGCFVHWSLERFTILNSVDHPEYFIKEFTIEDLKPHMLVLMSTGAYKRVAVVNGVITLYDTNSSYTLSKYKSLEDVSVGLGNYKIVEVYSEGSLNKLDKFFTTGNNLLWTRPKQKTAREIKVEELESIVKDALAKIEEIKQEN